MSLWFIVFIQLTAVAYALVGGVFLAFSDFIMRSLARTGGIGGIEAMQVINKEVFRWVFMTLLIGLVPVSLGLIGHAVFAEYAYSSLLFASAGAVYLVFCFGVTATMNVPMNDKLAKMDPALQSSLDHWTRTYLPRWTRWNTVRTLACALSSLLLLWGTTLLFQATPY